MSRLPELVAGGFGGPIVCFAVTPLRNACTLSATNPTARMGELYGQVFARGLARGWTGGIYSFMYACPTFLCIGPAYHSFKTVLGVPGACVAAACLESGLLYGAETCSAQMVKNQKSPGTFKVIHPSFKPWGPGLGLYLSRNILATAGLRIFCQPCTQVLEKVSGRSNVYTTFGGDFAGNILSAGATTPVHQLFGFTVTTPELHTMGPSEKMARMGKFLSDQYLVTENGRTRLSGNVPRDLFMRTMFVASLYTLYSTFERAVIRCWPQ